MSVLVFAENWEGKFKKQTFELVSYANRLAEMIKGSVSVVSIGKTDETELKKLGNYGADKIIKIEDQKLASLDNQAYTSVIAQVAKKEGSKIIVLSNNNSGKAVAPRLAANLQAGLVSGVIQLPSSVSPFVIRKRVFSGKALANISIKSDVKVLTLAQNSFEITENNKSASIESFSADLSQVAFGATVKSIDKQTGKIILTDADIVVSGGRGMKSPDNWGLLEDLAKILGAATACSRPVSDEGWRPHEEHTGQTGKIIAPNLYIAVGISGAIQHLAGISSSKVIVAINTDKEAPIFETANYGIIGDAMKVLPELIAALKQ